MSGAVSASTIAMVGLAAAGGMLASTMLSPKPKMPNVPAPEKPPNASKAPEMQGVRRQNAGAELGPAGVNNTLLTGPGGVGNDSLNLGKNTLLGA